MLSFKNPVYLIKSRCVEVSFPAFSIYFGFYILNNVQSAVQPMLPLYFLFYCLTFTKLANHCSLGISYWAELDSANALR